MWRPAGKTGINAVRQRMETSMPWGLLKWKKSQWSSMITRTNVGLVPRLAFSDHQPERWVADSGKSFECIVLAAIAARGTDDPFAKVKLGQWQSTLNMKSMRRGRRCKQAYSSAITSSLCILS